MVLPEAESEGLLGPSMGLAPTAGCASLRGRPAGAQNRSGRFCRTRRRISAPSLCSKHKKTPWRGLFYVWRRARDSNPRTLSGQRFSRPPHSTTLPALLKICGDVVTPCLTLAYYNHFGHRVTLNSVTLRIEKPGPIPILTPCYIRVLTPRTRPELLDIAEPGT